MIDESLLYQMRWQSKIHQYLERVQLLKINEHQLVRFWTLCQSGQFSLGPLFSLGLPRRKLLSRVTPHIFPWGSNKSQLLPLVSNSENCIRRFFTQALLLSYEKIKFIQIHSYLSFLSLTPQTLLLKLSSPMHFMSESSHSMTFVGGYLGVSPPPTSAIMLVRYSISTIPMPPSNSIGQIHYSISNLTSMESVFKRVRVVNAEPSGGTQCETTLVLVETYEKNLLFLRILLLIIHRCRHVGVSRLLFTTMKMIII